MNKITDSEFYMWRTLFAIAHVDGVVSEEEISFMAEALEDIPFSVEQEATLKQDIKMPQDVVEMFKKISNPNHQARFFKFAHDIVWADGEFSPAEQSVLMKLQKVHYRTTNVDDLVGQIDLKFDDGLKPVKTPSSRPRKTKQIVFSFRDEFLKKHGED